MNFSSDVPYCNGMVTQSFFLLLLFRSLAIGHQYSSLGTQPILCSSIPGLVPKQLRFCRNYVEIMPSVAEGVKIGIQECQHQFRGRRWNCTTVNNSLAIFGPVLDKGERTEMDGQKKTKEPGRRQTECHSGNGWHNL